MHISHLTQGTCARIIDLELDGDTIVSLKFVGGCRGNLEAISRLVVGKTTHEIMSSLRGIVCRNGTSCSDQLARALSGVAIQKAC